MLLQGALKYGMMAVLVRTGLHSVDCTLKFNFLFIQASIVKKTEKEFQCYPLLFVTVSPLLLT